MQDRALNVSIEPLTSRLDVNPGDGAGTRKLSGDRAAIIPHYRPYLAVIIVSLQYGSSRHIWTDKVIKEMPGHKDECTSFYLAY